MDIKTVNDRWQTVDGYKISYKKCLVRSLFFQTYFNETIMKGTYLGEFEEIVMLSIAALQQDAYGLAIKKELEEQTGRKISISAVHAACNRLETKGFLSSNFGEKSEMRGGKRKKNLLRQHEGSNGPERCIRAPATDVGTHSKKRISIFILLIRARR